MPLTTLTVVLLGVACVLAGLLLFLVWRRRSRDPSLRLARASNAIMTNVIVGTGDDGEAHLEYALLTPRGILVVNLKHIDGNLFAGDSMQEWAVISDKARFGFANPQDGLYDRIAAVKRLLPNTPVEGCIAFTGATVFAKGIPSHARLLDELISELEAGRGDADKLMPDWLTLKSAARSAS